MYTNQSDPFNEILKMLRNNKSFSEADCVKAIELVVDMLGGYMPAIPTNSIGDINFPNLSSSHLYPHLLRSDFKEPSPNRLTNVILDTCGFFFTSRSENFFSQENGKTKAMVYGIDRTGRWIAVVIKFDLYPYDDKGIACCATEFDVKKLDDLFIASLSELVRDADRFGNLVLTYDRILTNLLSIAERSLSTRKDQYEQALELVQKMKGCGVLVGHIITSAK